MNAKRKGPRNEHLSMRLLEASGCAITSAAASLGACDLVAVGSSDVVLCQVKTRDWPSAVEMETLRGFASQARPPLAGPRAAAGREGTVTTRGDPTGSRDAVSCVSIDLREGEPEENYHPEGEQNERLLFVSSHRLENEEQTEDAQDRGLRAGGKAREVAHESLEHSARLGGSSGRHPLSSARRTGSGGVRCSYNASWPSHASSNPIAMRGTPKVTARDGETKKTASAARIREAPITLRPYQRIIAGRLYRESKTSIK
jgi:hypothetical protein